MEPQQGRGTDGALLGFLKSSIGKPVQIDASDVALLSARQLQVLISAKRQWDADGHAFDVAIPQSVKFVEAEAEGMYIGDYAPETVAHIATRRLAKEIVALFANA